MKGYLRAIQCFDTVGWASQRAPGVCKTEKLDDAGTVILLELTRKNLHIIQRMSLAHYHVIVLCFVEIQNGLAFWYWRFPVALKKRPQNGCPTIYSLSSKTIIINHEYTHL